MNADLSKLSLGDLKRLQQDIELMIASHSKRETEKARQDILAIAQSVGLSVDELLKGSKPNKGVKPANKVAAKYQNPENNAEQWTGRGRKPTWFNAAIEAGKALQDLEIKQG